MRQPVGSAFQGLGLFWLEELGCVLCVARRTWVWLMCGFIFLVDEKGVFSLCLEDHLYVSCGCGSKLNRRGKPQVLVHVSTYQGNPFWNSGFLSHSHVSPMVIHGPFDPPRRMCQPVGFPLASPGVLGGLTGVVEKVSCSVPRRKQQG